MSSSCARVVVAVSMCSLRRAVPQAAHFGEGSPDATAFSSRFALGLLALFRMNVAWGWHTYPGHELRGVLFLTSVAEE